MLTRPGSVFYPLGKPIRFAVPLPRGSAECLHVLARLKTGETQADVARTYNVELAP